MLCVSQDRGFIGGKLAKFGGSIFLFLFFLVNLLYMVMMVMGWVDYELQIELMTGFKNKRTCVNILLDSSKKKSHTDAVNAIPVTNPVPKPCPNSIT